TGRVPGANDDVIIDRPGDVTVTCDARSVTIHSLVSQNALSIRSPAGGPTGVFSASPPAAGNNGLALARQGLAAGGGLTTGGLLTWTAAFQSPIAGPGRVRANGGMAVTGDGTKTLSAGCTLDNAGTATWTGNGRIGLVGGATWNNAPGATLVVQNGQTVGL